MRRNRSPRKGGPVQAAVIIATALCLAAAAPPGLAAASAPRVAPGTGAAPTRALDASRYPPQSYLPGELVVTLKEPTPANLEKLVGQFAPLLEEGKGEGFSAAALRRGPAVSLKLRPGVDELEAANQLLASPLVKAAEPNIIFRAAYVPNDPLYNQQWNLSGAYGVRAEQAWNTQKGSPSLTLAVIDTGLNHGHPDLAGRRLGGYDFLNGDWDPSDDNGHGTLVAGTACANVDNSLGLAGLDWYARIMPLKALDQNGEGNLTAVVNSVYYAADNGADVINMSLTSTTFSQGLQDAVEYAYTRGCLVIAAAGNEGTSRMDYPAGLTYVIGVGSTDQWGRRSSFSNYNSSVDIAAPGENILGPHLGDGYRRQSGTSEATPHVAAAALLVLAQYPGSEPDEVWRRLRDSARDLGGPGYDVEYGWGLLDVSGALSVPLVEVISPQDHSYPDSGKVSASATTSSGAIRYMELWVDGELEESHQFPVPGGSVSHTFTSWDLARLGEGSHSISVKAIETGGWSEGEQAVTVYRNRSQPRPSQDWYLAEGTTAWGFEEYVLVQNPDPAPASVRVTFMKPGGATQEHGFTMAGHSRLTIYVNELVASSDVSAHVRADRPVVVERAMYWRDRGGGHVAAGANRPSQDWYLAEGTTAWGFEEYVLVQNPDPAPASVRVTFMKPGGATQEHGFTMAGHSRLTIYVNELVASSDVSAHVRADRPVVVERAMYWAGKDGGHAALGVTGGCTTWYLAEGTTAWGFEEYVLVQNPNSTATSMLFEFLKPGGERMRAAYSVGPFARFTLDVDEVIAGSDVSLSIRADQPVIVERAMYWPRGSRSRAEGHCSAGSTTAADTWYLAEGTTAWGFEEYILLANPTADIAHATLVFMRTDGSNGYHDVEVPAGARITVMANEVDPGRDASVKVVSDRPLVVERAVYWDGKEGGTGALGVLSP